jgi:hypothetical protein
LISYRSRDHLSRRTSTNVDASSKIMAWCVGAKRCYLTREVCVDGLRMVPKEERQRGLRKLPLPRHRCPYCALSRENGSVVLREREVRENPGGRRRGVVPDQLASIFVPMQRRRGP